MSVHFGRTMDLCHLKHAERSPELQNYKGRVVFRGDQVKDETVFAQFSQIKAPQLHKWQRPSSWTRLLECQG